jgi:hypothetical protein
MSRGPSLSSPPLPFPTSTGGPVMPSRPCMVWDIVTYIYHYEVSMVRLKRADFENYSASSEFLPVFNVWILASRFQHSASLFGVLVDVRCLS